MKLYADTANINDIKRLNELGIIDGVTTNPSLVAKEGRDYNEVIKEICKIVNGPVSAEVLSITTKEMVLDGIAYSKLHKNVVVKIPMTAEGLKATKELNGKGIKVNTTLIFTPLQALLAAKAGAAYVSPFIGRLDDISQDGMQIIQDIVEIFQNYEITTEIIVASVRNPLHIRDAAIIGADICTCPPNVLEQIIKHPLTDIGLKKFLEDWEKSRK
ncbi:fructose-6-phosphate aldolase [Candidatus Woesearchaeota archaeon]|nr:fructose-6-phosphate aldolase [Candidatus Woesearchaeota archaeon]